MTAGDIEFAEIHDCFTIAEIIATEDLGFIERGQGGPWALAGGTRRDGEKPVNASGGLKSKGHPVGATGVAQICGPGAAVARRGGRTATGAAFGRAGAKPGRIGRDLRGQHSGGGVTGRTGTVYTETVVHAAPAAFSDETPYQVAIVDLDEGGKVTARVIVDRWETG